MIDDQRPPIIRAYLGDDEVIVDNFAGGLFRAQGVGNMVPPHPAEALIRANWRGAA